MSTRKAAMASNEASQAIESRASSLRINLSTKNNTKQVRRILATARTKRRILTTARTKRRMKRRQNNLCYVQISMEARTTLFS
jgi:hypothetical protein